MPGTPRLVAFAAVCTAAAAAVLWFAGSRPTPAPSEPSARPAAHATDAPPAATDTDRAVREGAATSADAVAPTTATAVLRGRCLAAEDGAPLTATVHIGTDDGTPDGDAGALPAAALASATTGADGRFTCAVPLAVATDLRLHVQAAERAPVGCRRDAVAPGTTWDLGDVRLVRSARVRGEVKDTTGAPVAGAEVGLIMLGQDRPALAFRESHTATTDERGVFVFAAPIASGEWYIRVERTGALRTPRKTQVPAGGEHVVPIEVERPDPALAIRGKVKDRDGAPMAGIELSAHGEGARGAAVSGADGTFVLHKGPPHFDRGQAGVELEARGDGLEQVVNAQGRNVSWGQHDVVVVMQPLTEIVVRALDERGSVVWPFTVVVGKVTANGDAWQPLPARQQRAGADHVVLTRLASGPHTLVLRPKDPQRALAGPLPFHVDDATPRELVVRLPDRADVQVDVVDAAGTAVNRCTLELVASLTAQPPDASAPAPDLAARTAPANRWPRQFAIATAATDGEGRATFEAPPGTWLLRARCRTHLPAAQTVTVGTGTSRHRLVLQAATVVRGRLVPAEALPALGLLETAAERRPTVIAQAGRSELARAEVATDGTFDLGPLPPGLATLRLAAWLTASDAHRGAVPHTLGSVDGTGAPHVEREYDVSSFVPATATGVVVWDGAPLRNGQFFLRRWQPEPGHHVRVATDGEGRFRTFVPPGTLGVQLAIPSEPGPGHVILPLQERWQVAAGGALELRIDARMRRLRLRVLGPDGAPFASSRVRIESPDGYNRPGSLPTDAAGRTDVSLAPYGTFTVFAKNAEGRDLASAPCTIGPAAEAGVVEVPLALQTR